MIALTVPITPTSVVSHLFKPKLDSLNIFDVIGNSNMHKMVPGRF